MKKIIHTMSTFILALVFLASTIVSTGCPSQSGIEKAAKTSLRLSQLTRDAIAATRRAYESNLMSLETKDKMAIQLDKVIAGGETFNEAVKRVHADYKAGNKDPNALRLLDSLLTSEVTTPFLAFLQLTGVISQQQAPYLWVAINALRTALLLIGSFVSYNTVKFLEKPLRNDYNVVYENKIPLGGRYLYARKFC